jgi:hypothetical protein
MSAPLPWEDRRFAERNIQSLLILLKDVYQKGWAYYEEPKYLIKEALALLRVAHKIVKEYLGKLRGFRRG